MAKSHRRLTVFGPYPVIEHLTLQDVPRAWDYVLSQFEKSQLRANLEKATPSISTSNSGRHTPATV